MASRTIPATAKADVDPNFTAQIVALRTQADAVTCMFYCFDENAHIDPSGSWPLWFSAPSGPDTTLGVFVNCFGDANMLIRKQALDAIGGFTEDYGRGYEDWELLARLLLEGHKVQRVAEPLFWYRLSATSMIRGRTDRRPDLLRSIRAYRMPGRPELFRLALIAQGLLLRGPGTPNGAVWYRGLPIFLQRLLASMVPWFLFQQSLTSTVRRYIENMRSRWWRRRSANN